nr:hypothetical protein [Tanacetum cinerariifolium]
MAADHGGDWRSTVAVNNGRRWQTTVDCRWTTIDHHRTTGQRWLVESGLGLPHGMPRVSHVCPHGIHMDADVDNMQRMGIDPGTL